MIVEIASLFGSRFASRRGRTSLFARRRRYLQRPVSMEQLESRAMLAAMSFTIQDNSGLDQSKYALYAMGSNFTSSKSTNDAVKPADGLTRVLSRKGSPWVMPRASCGLRPIAATTSYPLAYVHKGFRQCQSSCVLQPFCQMNARVPAEVRS